jgi:hypothetical protein
LVLLAAGVYWRCFDVEGGADRHQIVARQILAHRYDNRGRTYQAYILYEYSVDGVTRRSDVWRLGAGTSSYTKASTSAVERYPVGAAVTVFVNPDNPADAVLEPANPSWFVLIAGIVFAAAGLLLFSRAS